jgi:hypothetical protein
MASMDKPNKLYSLLENLVCNLSNTATPPPGVINRVARLIRPANSSIEANVHTHAIKLRIRNALINKYGKGLEGPAAVAEFEKEIDTLRNLDSMHWQAFLALMEPLALSGEIHSEQNTFFTPPIMSHQKLSTNIQKSEPKETILPYSNPVLLDQCDVLLVNDQSIWVSREVELLLLRDLLLIFQVT